MAFNFNRYDQEKISDGTWEEIDGGQFKIAKSGNPRHLEAIERIGKELQEKWPNGDIPVIKRIEAKAKEFAEGVLRDWKEVANTDGDSVPYSVENATTLLMNDEPLYEALMRKSRDMARFENKRIESQKKKR
ncbi:hypothetical protein [Vreelandella aquamarina]|uniref:Uncharacterized protein n=1 Tax=Vreelandella aquamarina TaxID=77097 RepID=A0A857GNH1_9GAMM|nr:hypothetical protein [Halomonas meridiana]QHD50056.1 hypothetical protein CTT34_10325 [Halomonas meridiana]